MRADYHDWQKHNANWIFLRNSNIFRPVVTEELNQITRTFISHSLLILPNIRTLSYKQLYHINPLVCLLFLMKNDQVTKLHTDSRLNNTDQDPVSLILKKQPFTLKKHVGEICHGPPTCYITMVQGKCADLDVMSHTKINEWHTLWPFILHTPTQRSTHKTILVEYIQ